MEIHPISLFNAPIKSSRFPLFNNTPRSVMRARPSPGERPAGYANSPVLSVKDNSKGKGLSYNPTVGECPLTV
eukprot:3363787-Prymnesium_polylepis.1